MAKRSIFIIICIAILLTTAARSAHALSFTFIKGVVDVLKTSYKYYSVAKDYAKLTGYVPHTFPFGGHITSSERACSIKWITWVTITYPFVGPIGTPFPGYFPFLGRAIEVGPPVPTNGKVIDFPFISDVYRNNQEDKVGPWALGLGFTPFPLDQINKALGAITIVIGGNPLSTCGPQQFYTGVPVGGTCSDHFRIDCQASGEKDQLGNDIYKVILKLGTSF